jgi:hypothetical protein
MTEATFTTGGIIFRAGDPGERAYLIREGVVDLIRDGSAPPVAKLTAGDVFGEMSLIEERPHTLTARAATLTRVTPLTRDEFEEMLTSDPVTFRVYLKALFERLRNLPPEPEVPFGKPVVDPAGPTVIIHPLTRRAAETLPDEGLLITKFPFRIGRVADEKEKEPLDLNDLWLLDRHPFNISRNHAVLELRGDNVLVRDRGSSLGIHINDEHVGGKHAKRFAILDEGDNVVVLGGRLSPYQFRVHVSGTGAA